MKDTGIGISSKEHNKLFKMHFRGVNAINSKNHREWHRAHADTKTDTSARW